MRTLRYIVAISFVNVLSLSGLVVAVDFWQSAVRPGIISAQTTGITPTPRESQPTATPRTSSAVTFGSVSAAAVIREPSAVSQKETPPPESPPQDQPPQEQSPQDQPPPEPQPQEPQPAGCIITVDGASYDVTDFRNIHGGGDIFTCGADMSAVFWSQHDAGTLSKMSRYRVQ